MADNDNTNTTANMASLTDGINLAMLNNPVKTTSTPYLTVAGADHHHNMLMSTSSPSVSRFAAPATLGEAYAYHQDNNNHD